MRLHFLFYDNNLDVMSSVIQFDFQARAYAPQEDSVAEDRVFNGLISTIYNLPESQDVLCDIQLLTARQRKLYLLPASVRLRSDIGVSAPLHLSFTLMASDARRVMTDTRGVSHHVHGVMGSIDVPSFRP